MQYPIEEEVLDELIWWVKNHVEQGQVIYTLCDLRDGLEDVAAREYFQEIIDEMAEELKCCPKCGISLHPIIEKEYHHELDGSPYEYIVNGYWCDDCSKKYDL